MHPGGINIPFADGSSHFLESSVSPIPWRAMAKLRFFSGLTAEEAAPMVGLSLRTAHRLWTFARAWLRRNRERSADPEP